MTENRDVFYLMYLLAFRSGGCAPLPPPPQSVYFLPSFLFCWLPLCSITYFTLCVYFGFIFLSIFIAILVMCPNFVYFFYFCPLVCVVLVQCDVLCAKNGKQILRFQPFKNWHCTILPSFQNITFNNLIILNYFIR